MQKQFEYKPFDRVTVSCLGAQMQCVILGEHQSRTGNYKVCAFFTDSGDVDGIGALSDEIRPGHYDADGNWLPQPGELCYMLNKDLQPIPYMIISVDGKYAEAIDLTDYEPVLEKYVIVDSAAVAAEWDGSKMIYPPETAFLYPGRIKTSQQ